MYGVEETNVFFARQGVDIKNPARDYPAADTSYGFSTNPLEMPTPSYGRTELSDEELEATKRAYIAEAEQRVQEAGARSAIAEGDKIQAQITNLEKELEFAEKLTPENQALLEKKAKLEQRLKVIKRGGDPDAPDKPEKAPYQVTDEVSSKANTMMDYLQKFAGSKGGKLLGAVPVLGTPLSALDLPRRKEVLMSTGEYTEAQVDQYLAQEFAKEEFTPQGMIQGAGMGVQALFGDAPSPEEQDQQEIDRMRSQMQGLGISSNIEYY